MECSRVMELLSEYADDELDSETSDEIRKHMESCSSCKYEYELLMGVIDNCRRLGEVDLPGDFNKNLHEKLISEGNSYKNRYIWLKRYGAVAAVLILFISIGFMVRSDMFGMKRTKSSSVAQENMKTSSEKKVQSKANGSADEKKNFDMNQELKSQRGGKSVNEISLMINLNGEEYTKDHQNIINTVYRFGGCKIQYDNYQYKVPINNLFKLYESIKDDYKIKDILLNSEDKTLQYKKLYEELDTLKESEGKNPDSADIKKQIDKEESELKEMDESGQYFFVSIKVLR